MKSEEEIRAMIEVQRTLAEKNLLARQFHYVGNGMAIIAFALWVLDEKPKNQNIPQEVDKQSPTNFGARKVA